MEGFGGAPRFLAYPRAFTVRSGTDAVLSCQITGDPRPSILWEKDKSPIEPSGRFHMEAKGDLYSLLVSHITPRDSGLYVCKAKNNIGETYAATALKVEAGETQEEEEYSNNVPPAFLVAPSSMRVRRGEDVMFTCRVSGQPCPVLEWEKDGHKLSDQFESSHFMVGQEPEDWHFLKLFGARPPDGGVYVCRARSGSQEAMAAAVLLVEPPAPPDGLPNGSPADGPEPLAEQQQHRRRHTVGQRMGLETWVPNGVVPAGVPRAKVFAVSVGKHAKFRCYVTGKPKPEIIWQKDGEPLTPGRRHLIYEDREGYFILKVLYCKPKDQGLYVCTASNTAGQTLSAVRLQVKGRSVPRCCWGQPGAEGVQGSSSSCDLSLAFLGSLLPLQPGSPQAPPDRATGWKQGMLGCPTEPGPPLCPLSPCREVVSLEGCACPATNGEGGQCLGDKFPWKCGVVLARCPAGHSSKHCAGSHPIPQSHPASWEQHGWGDPAAGASLACTPLLPSANVSAMACWCVSPKTPC